MVNTQELAEFRGTTFVIKLGGEESGNPAALHSLVESMVRLHAEGVQLVVVHGGGQQAQNLAQRLGIPLRRLGSQPGADDDILEVMKMTLAGTVNTAIISACRGARLDAVGVSGVSAGVIEAVKRPIRRGDREHSIESSPLGEVVRVNPDFIRLLLGRGYVPIIAALGANELGHVFNLNVDVAANQVAAALRAQKLIVLTQMGGLFRQGKTPPERLASLAASEVTALIGDGELPAVLAPWLSDLVAVLRGGVAEIHILANHGPEQLIKECLDPGTVGTHLFG